jgi:protein-tyrosine phosphatase
VNSESDFDRFDLFIVMDDHNIRDLNGLARNEDDRKKIFRMTDFCTIFKHRHVPDPYYGGSEGFELVLDLLEDACGGLILHLEKESISE